MLAAVVCALCLAGSAGVTSGQMAPAPAVSPAAASSLPELDATAAVGLLCSRRITARQYMSSLFDRLFSGYTCLNAFQYANVSLALAEADAIDARADAGEDIGPLCGLPIAIKDSTDVEGLPTSVGTPALVGYIPPFSAPLVDQYRAANGIVMGKTALHELSAGGTSIGPTSNNLSTVLNSWNVRYHCGGSSGGAGAALAARLTPLASCEDTGGSCRMPASATGTVGLRPTLGCYDYSDGLAPASFTRDTVGSMARNMGDLILLDSIFRTSNATSRGHGALPEPGVACAAQVDKEYSLEGIKIGLPVDYWQSSKAGIDSAIMGVFENAMDKMEGAGVEFQYINMSEVFAMPGAKTSPGDFEEPREFARYLYTHAVQNSAWHLSVYDVFSRINSPVVFNSTYAQLKNGLSTPLGNPDKWVDYLGKDRPEYVQAWHDTYSDNDLTAIMYPSYATELRPIDLTEPNCQGPNGTITACGTTRYVTDDAKAAQAILSLPLGLSTGGLPVGANFAGPLGSDSTILSLGLALEQLIGRMPAPPSMPGCMGCSANVTNQTLTWSGKGPLGANDVWSAYNLKFDGECMDASLASYGQGVSGVGPPSITSTAFSTAG